jgi:putative ABC transport system permease protein
VSSAYLEIGWLDLALAAALLAVNFGISAALRLGLTRSLLVAAVRMTVQLWLVGFVLEWVFAAERPWVILAMALVMAAVAGVAAVHRTSRRFVGVYWDSLLTILVVSFLITGFAVLGVLRVDPWWYPQYLIPLLGMLLGNALTGISLGLDRFLEGYVGHRDRLEGRMVLGATRWETARGEVREALRVALIPTVNSMLVMGVVSLPGMMTGQILAGADPADAVRYQILIMLMIAACVALASLGVVSLAFLRLVSPRPRLRSERLRGSTGNAR